MAYSPSTLTIDSWSVPLTISGADAIADLDDTVNAIMDTDAASAKVHINTELAKLPNYFTSELNSMYGELGEAKAHQWATEDEDVEVESGEYSAYHWAKKSEAAMGGITASNAELNIMDGATLTTEELNILDGVTSTYAELNILDGVTSTTEELNKVDGYTGTATELNYAKSLYDTGVTSTEFNALDGVTSDIQTQFGLKAPLASPTFTGTVTLPAATVVNVVTDTTPQLGGDLDCNGKTLNESAVRQLADASLGTGTYTFDYNTADMVQLTATGSITLAVSNFPSGDVAGYMVDCVNFGAYTITHPAAWLLAGSVVPNYTSSGTDRILLTSDKDGVITLTVIAYDIGVA